MRRLFTLATVGLTLAGALAAASPAAAQYRYRDRDRNRGGDALAAGVLGFALGAAVGGSGANGRYRQNYYAPGYGYRGGGYGYGGGVGFGGGGIGYGGGYYAPPRAYGGYGYGYRGPSRCVVQRQWDPYWGRSVSVRRCW